MNYHIGNPRALYKCIHMLLIHGIVVFFFLKGQVGRWGGVGVLEAKNPLYPRLCDYYYYSEGGPQKSAIKAACCLVFFTARHKRWIFVSSGECSRSIWNCWNISQKKKSFSCSEEEVSLAFRVHLMCLSFFFSGQWNPHRRLFWITRNETKQNATMHLLHWDGCAAFLGFIAFTSSNRTRCSFTWLDSPEKMQDN